MPERRPELSLHDWAVLGVLVGGESHGFAVAKELAPHGEVGRVWTVSRPQVYRSLDRLIDLGLVEPVERQPGDAGPDRTVLAATARGRDRLRRWLLRPVAHLRDVRSELLVKLLLAERQGIDARPLVEAQRAAFAPTLDALAASDRRVDGVVEAWRHESAEAVRRFLDRLDR